MMVVAVISWDLQWTGDDDGPKDYNLWYQSMDHSVWLPGPKGYVVSEDMEEDPANSFFMS